MKIRLPAAVRAVLDTLRAHGFEAYAVGGCVRDSIFGREPDDWDITTSARPEEVKRLFRKTVDTGLKHGTVTVLVGGASCEVTTYRIDGDYEDCRHPKEVTFTRNLQEDLKRRDFTINAMAYSDETGLVDLFGGMDDLQRRRIRCVGDPAERFQEDALRILRAIRFSAQLGFSIERETASAMKKLAPNLEKISAERICAELTKLLLSGHPEYLKDAYEAGVTAVILPEFDRMMETPQNNPHHYLSVGEHTLKALAEVPADRTLRFTMLLHDTGKPETRKTDRYGIDHFKGHVARSEEIARSVMRRLRMDNQIIHDAGVLIRYHDWRLQPEPRQVRRALSKIGTELFPKLLDVQYADSMAQAERFRPQNEERITTVFSVYEKIIEEEQCFQIRDLAIDGGDLIRLGYPQGPAVGKALQAALETVMDDPEKNSRETLLKLAERDRGAFIFHKK